ncbi:MAG TPA: SRPBCC family protein [Actinomycetales bacterium]|nr:SRPBCC family protein [Actinomycetales bacterium]
MAEHTESSTVIDAAPADVLAVIADLEAYPDWAGGVKSVEVLSTKSGRPQQARFQLDSGPIKDTYVLEYTWPSSRTGTGVVSWVLVEANIISKLDGQYDLAREGDGTKVTYRLTVDVRMPMLGMLKRKAEKVIIDTALKDLKKRVEVLAERGAGRVEG